MKNLECWDEAVYIIKVQERLTEPPVSEYHSDKRSGSGSYFLDRNSITMIFTQMTLINRSFKKMSHPHIADLLGIFTELLSIPLRRFEFLRRAAVKVMSVFMAKMDLSNREYGISYDEAIASIAPTIEKSLGRPPGDDFESLRPRPILIEAIRLALEERDNRSSLAREIMARIHRTVELALPKSAEVMEGFHTRPDDPIEVFAFVGTRNAHRTTREIIEILQGESFDDLGILDLAIAVADADDRVNTIYCIFSRKPPF